MHPYLGGWTSTLVLAHVLSAFAFALLHGPAVAAMLALRARSDVPTVRALLDLSRRWTAYAWAALALLAATGALLASAEHTWRLTWVWASAVVLVVVSALMSPLAARALNEARAAAGAPWFDGRRMREAGPADPAALEAARERIAARAWATLALGLGGLATLVWLMVAKPLW